jgi:hypothetical protein
VGTGVHLRVSLAPPLFHRAAQPEIMTLNNNYFIPSFAYMRQAFLQTIFVFSSNNHKLTTIWNKYLSLDGSKL